MEQKAPRVWTKNQEPRCHSPALPLRPSTEATCAGDSFAKALKAKGYPYQYYFCQDSGHGIGNARAQLLPAALEWLWQGYQAR